MHTGGAGAGASGPRLASSRHSPSLGRKRGVFQVPTKQTVMNGCWLLVRAGLGPGEGKGERGIGGRRIAANTVFLNSTLYYLMQLRCWRQKLEISHACPPNPAPKLPAMYESLLCQKQNQEGFPARGLTLRMNAAAGMGWGGGSLLPPGVRTQ